jgi:hypothetical protein
MTNRASAPIRVKNVIKATLSRPIAFHPLFAQICGMHINAGLLLSQAYYWSERTSDPQGWFWKDAKQWNEETCLSKHELVAARRILRKLDLMEEKLEGVPPIVHFRVNFDRLCAAIDQFAEERQINLPESGKLESPKSGKLNGRKAANQTAEERQINSPETSNSSLLGSESTSETTTESTAAAARDIFISLPLVDRTELKITRADVAEWERLYPSVDVQQQLRNMRGHWLADRTRKSADSMRKSVVRWLSEEQARAPKPPRTPAALEQVKTQRIVLPKLDVAGVHAFEIVRDHLRAKVNRHSFDTWIKPLRGIGSADSKLYVLVPTPEFKHVTDKYADLIAESMPREFTAIVLYVKEEVE